MSHPCPAEHCDRPAPGHARICGACLAEVERALHQVPALARDLDTTLARQTGRAASSGRPRETPLPYSARASEAGWVLRSTLVGWVRTLAEHITPHPGPACPRCAHPSCGVVRYSRGPADTPSSMAAWLAASRTRLARHPAADEAHAEITGAVREAQRAVDRPAERQFAGRCRGCDTALYARPGAADVQCRECDADPVDVDDQRAAMLDQVLDQLATAAQAADILTRLAAPLKPGTIRQWAQRGRDGKGRIRLFPHGTDPHGHPLYRVSDVRDLLVEKLEREQAARAKREAGQAAHRREKVAS